jgi:DNA-binding MarR family transcriptional regulator
MSHTTPFPGTPDLLCFALYSANNAMHRVYRPLLAPLGLTYPQYLVLVALWSSDGRSVGSLCDELGLESNTLTPLLKRMETAGLIHRRRDTEDERVVLVHLAEKGEALRQEAEHVTRCTFAATGLSLTDLADLRSRLFALRDQLESGIG